jgi:hypothetical protein
MAGTFATDYAAPNLLTGADLATDGDDVGDVVEAAWWGDVTFVLTLGTVTGANKIVLQGCETEDFTTDDVVTFGTFDTTDGGDDTAYQLTAHVMSKYVRASVTIGTGGDLSGATLVPHTKHYARTRLNSSAPLA